MTHLASPEIAIVAISGNDLLCSLDNEILFRSYGLREIPLCSCFFSFSTVFIAASLSVGREKIREKKGGRTTLERVRFLEKAREMRG